MGNIRHKKVTVEFYSIVISSSNRQMPQRLNDFFSCFNFDELGDCDWDENHITLRDFDGDLEGIEIFHGEPMLLVYDYIADKLGVDVGELGETSIKITNI